MTNKYYVDYKDILQIVPPTNVTDWHVNNFYKVKQFIDMRKNDENLKLVIRAKKEDILALGFSKNINNCLPNLFEIGIQPSDVVFVVDNNAQSYVYTNSEWDVVNTLSKYVEKLGASFGIEDYFKTFSVKQVENANAKIDSIASEIKSKGFSPYEKLMSAYLTVTSREYTNESPDDEAAVSRSVYDVLNSDKIVCVGYSYWLKAIMDAVGDENIKVYPNSVACSKDNVYVDGYHSNLIVYIKDEKYGIDGYYYADPTWDSTTKQGKQSGFLNYFLVPLSDIENISYHIRKKDALDFKPELNEEANGEPVIEKPKKYNMRNSTQNVSFTSDGFSPSHEFLRDLIDKKPKAVKGLLDDIAENKRQICLNNIQESQKILDIYNGVQKALKDKNIGAISQVESTLLVYAVLDAFRTSDITKALDEVEKLASMYSGESNIEREISNFVEDIISKTYGTDRSIEHYLGIDQDDDIGKYISLFGNKFNNYVNDEKNKKNVSRIPALNVDTKDDIYQLAKCCKTEADLDGLIKFIDKELQKYKTLDNFVWSDDRIEEKIKSAKEIIRENNAELKKLKSLNPDNEIITEILSNKKSSKFIEEVLLGMSDPLELKTTASALKTVLKASYNATDEQIASYVDRVVAKNVELATKQFYGEARNAFFVRAKASFGPTTSDEKET